MFRVLLAILLPMLCLASAEASIHVRAERVDLTQRSRNWMTPINVEHAVTTRQLRWGLMQRDQLEENQGMTFNFARAGKLNFWMFNILIDLSLAICDDHGIIREIHELKARPDLLDPKRPVTSIKDLRFYPPTDPILSYFKKEGIRSKTLSQRALEMGKDWFKNNDIHLGDVAVWTINSEQGFICHSLDIGRYEPRDDEPIMLDLPGDKPHSFWLPNSDKNLDIALLTEDFQMLFKTTLRGSKSLAPEEKIILYSIVPIHYALLAPEGWLDKHFLKDSITVNADEIFIEIETTR